MAQYSVAVRNAALDAIETVVGPSPLLQIFTGSKPANCAAASTGTKLVEINCPSDWMENASAGTKVLKGTWSVNASGTGTAGYYRLMDSTGTTCHEQGTITMTGSGGDMTVDNTSIAVGQSITITAKTVTAGGA